MDEPAPTSRISPGALVAGGGGLAALLGVFLAWGRLTSSFEGGEFAGQAFGPQSRAVSVVGIDHWSGILALVASVLVLAGAVGSALLRDDGQRRLMALGTAAAGAVVAVAAILGIVFSESIALGGIEGGRQAVRNAEEFARQLGVRGFRAETGPGVGVFVTLVGGAAAAAGGFLAARRGSQPAPVPPAPTAAGTGFGPIPGRPGGPDVQPPRPAEPPPEA